jgi:lysophospholipase L1-like esterase
VTANRPTHPNVLRLTLRKKLLFGFATWLLVFGGAEVALRLANGWNQSWVYCHRRHPVLGWCLREGWTGDWWWTGGYSRVNAQGLRDDQPVGPKAAGEKRLLVLGDSVAFGAKVRTEQAYPAQLEQVLRATGLGWRVLNAGVNGYDSAQEADWLEEFGWRLEPDVVAIAFCRNDIIPSSRDEAVVAGQKLSLPRPSWDLGGWLTEHSIVAAKLQRGLWRVGGRLGLATATVAPHPGGGSEDGQGCGWPFVEHAYRRVARRAREENRPVVVFIFPWLHGLNGQATDDLGERLRALGEELHWTVIDLAPAFTPGAASLFFEGDPIHPNAEGYRRAANYACQELKARSALP